VIGPCGGAKKVSRSLSRRRTGFAARSRSDVLQTAVADIETGDVVLLGEGE
jgi:hypothetical protein